MEFYRKPLPATCIDFSSKEGKLVFTEALLEGHMNIFFKLCAQFRTQDEPAFCGLTSLVMALNALEIDPGRVWKGPWRWFHEEMLDCCAPINTCKEKGINMDQFVCLAMCNNLIAVKKNASEIGSLDELREKVIEICTKEDTVLVASYSRKAFGQTGDGHFSPIAGFHQDKDLVLILDTARFKYPPHWVSLQMLLDAMRTTDKDTGNMRGYILLSSAHNQKRALLFTPSYDFAINIGRGDERQIMKLFAEEWNRWLSSPAQVSSLKELLQDAVSFLLLLLSKGDFSLKLFCAKVCCFQEQTNILASLGSWDGKEGEEIQSGFQQLFREMESLDIFKLLHEDFAARTRKDIDMILNLMTCNVQSVSGSCSNNNLSKCCDLTRSEAMPTAATERQISLDMNLNQGTIIISAAHLVGLFLYIWPNQYSVGKLFQESGNSAGSGQESYEIGQPCQILGQQTKGCALNKFLSMGLSDSRGTVFVHEVESVQLKFIETLKYHILSQNKDCCCN